MPSPQSRRWCFTLNNYSDSEYLAVIGLANSVSYLIVGKEVGETGTPHLQGYVVFQSNCRLAGAKRHLGSRCHLACAMGSSAQNRAYCSKGGDFFETGICPESDGGAREKIKWDLVKEAAKKGFLDDVPDDVFVRNYSTLRQIAKDYQKKPDDAPDVTGIWIHGKAGIGKSRYARFHYPTFFDKNLNKWWDGYQGEDSVLLDDFSTDHACLRNHLKRWADRYSFGAEIKGGALQIRPKNIIVTSQYSIDDIWEDEATRDAMKRRFTVHHLIFPWTEPTGESEAPRDILNEIEQYLLLD